MKSDLFQSCGHCWVFHTCWHIECSTFTASSFRIWNSSIRIPSTPLALFVVMLPKAHLTSHSRMSGSRLVITISWLSGSWTPCLYSSSVYFCHFSLIFYSFVRSIPFSVLYWAHLFMKYSLGLSNFLEEISSLSHSIISSISLHWLLRKAFLSLLAILWNSAFRCLYRCFSPLLFASLLFTAICKASSDSHFSFLHFFFLGWSWSLSPVKCHELPSIIHQALCLSDLVP